MSPQNLWNLQEKRANKKNLNKLQKSEEKYYFYFLLRHKETYIIKPSLAS